MATSIERVRVPTVSRVIGDTLVELVYDPSQRTTALALSRYGGLWNLEQEVTVDTGEVLVPYGASNNLIANECLLLPSRPSDSGLKHELLADIQAFLHRYVDLSPLFELIAAHYILLSWVYDRFGELPYVRLRGDYGVGKTRGLLAIGSLCYKPFFASGASTVSPIFHTLDSFGGTLVLDEADFPMSDAKADLVKVLNNGTVRGIPVLRTTVNHRREFSPTAFRVFGPKLIAMRSAFDDRALESRFLTEEMGTRALRSDIPLHLPETLKAEALALRNRLLHFRLCEFFKINANSTVLIDGVEPRTNQMAIPLLSMVDDPEVRRAISDMLIAEDAERRFERTNTAEGAVLDSALRAFSVLPGATTVPLRAIAECFNAVHGADYGGSVSNKWVGYILRTRLRISTRKSVGVYVVPASEKSKLDVLAARYGLTDTTANAFDARG